MNITDILLVGSLIYLLIRVLIRVLIEYINNKKTKKKIIQEINNNKLLTFSEEEVNKAIDQFWSEAEKILKNVNTKKLDSKKNMLKIRAVIENILMYYLRTYLIIVEIYADEEKQGLVFTSEGDTRFFPYIKKIVEKAPKLESWEFEAFRGPKDISGIKIFNLEINVEDLRFAIMPITTQDKSNNKHIKILLAVICSFPIENKEKILHAVAVILIHILGEYLFSTLIIHIDILSPEEMKDYNLDEEHLVDADTLKKIIIEGYENEEFSDIDFNEIEIIED